MLILLSPAKTMDMSPALTEIAGTEPHYEAEANLLAAQMRAYSTEELEKLLKISGKLAAINFERYQRFESPEAPRSPAIFAYNGSVFKEIGVSTFSKADLLYAQDHLRMISTLYGLVRPLDLIKAYRIAFALKLGAMEGKDLYHFWLPKLTGPLICDARIGGGIIVNLASLDVLGALKMDEIYQQTKVITPEFQVYRHGKYETVRTYAKMARGAMARYILLNRIESPEKLKDFEWKGFVFAPEISDRQKYIFVRKE